MLEHQPQRGAPAWLTDPEVEDTTLGLLKTGKEAEVFVVERRHLALGHRALLAHKRYRPMEVGKGVLEGLGFARARSFVDDAMYHEGRRFRRSREKRAVEKQTDYGKKLLADRWPEQELDMIGRLHAAGADVPYPVEFSGDGMLMQYLGDDERAAPRLVDARLDRDRLQAAWGQVLTNLRVFAAAGIVHADLSPYNVLVWADRLWIIDLPQAVDLVRNPHGFDLLHRDVSTVASWFSRKGVPVDAEEVFSDLLTYAL